jgi:hypothetical protein
MSSVEDFEVRFRNTIEATLKKTFGVLTAKSIFFYVDTSIALKNPDFYADSLKRIFGPTGSAAILRSLVSDVSATFGLEKSDWSSFSECVSKAKEKSEKAALHPTQATDI